MSRVPPAAPDALAPARLRVQTRVGAGALSLGSAAVLVTAAMMTPSASGMGTHTQLGLPPCSWPLTLGVPCPACGMTTAFSRAAHGDLVGSVHAQPAGAALAFITAVALLVSLHAAVTGSPVAGLYGKLFSKYAWIVGSVLLVSAWSYKILQFRGILP